MVYYIKQLACFLMQVLFLVYCNVYGAHLIYYNDGRLINKDQFNSIKTTVLDKYEFPKALENKDYDPDADETIVIQGALDSQFNNSVKKTENTLDKNNQSATLHVRWVPDTLYDLFRYKYSQNEHDEHYVNDVLNKTLMEFPQNNIESDADYYIRIAEPLINFLIQDCVTRCDSFFKYYKSQDAFEPTIKKAIVVEVDQHKRNPQSVLLYRGRGSLKDFDTNDAYQVGLYGKYAPYCLHAVGKKSIYPEMISYGASLLSNIKHCGGACPLVYALSITSNKGFHADADLYVLPVLKKNFMKSKSCFWFINQKYDGHQNFYGNCTRFHPRKKAITTEYIIQNIGIIEHEFTPDDERVMIFDSMDTALTALHNARLYLLHHAIGITDYTKSNIIEAQKQYAKGKFFHNYLFFSIGYCNSLIGYKEKTWFIENLNKIGSLPLIKDMINATKNAYRYIKVYNT